MDKRRKWVKQIRKGKGEKVKKAQDEEVNGQGRKRREKGYPGPTRGCRPG